MADKQLQPRPTWDNLAPSARAPAETISFCPHGQPPTRRGRKPIRGRQKSGIDTTLPKMNTVNIARRTGSLGNHSTAVCTCLTR